VGQNGEGAEGSYSRAYLALGRPDGAAPREGGGSVAVLKGRRRCGACGRLVRARWCGVERQGGPGPFYRRPKAVREGEDFSGGRSPVSSRAFSMSGRTSRRPVTRRLEQRQVNFCRDGACRGGAGLAACGGGDGGRPAGPGAGWPAATALV
jgi:hypothetical protein